MLFKPRLFVNTIIHKIKGKRKKVRLEDARIWRAVSFEGDNYIGKGTLLSYCDIGRMSYVASHCILEHIEIGRYCSIGSFCTIAAGNHPTSFFVSTHPAFYDKYREAGMCYVDKNKFEEYSYADSERKKHVVVENDVWIANNVILLNGVRVGNGAVVMAGAVVTKNVPPYSIVGGVPAKVIKYRFPEETIDWLQEFRWWEKSEEWIRAHADLFDDIEEFKHIVSKEMH